MLCDVLVQETPQKLYFLAAIKIFVLAWLSFSAQKKDEEAHGARVTYEEKG